MLTLPTGTIPPMLLACHLVGAQPHVGRQVLARWNPVYTH
jgi:hypothetical protein